MDQPDLFILAALLALSVLFLLTRKKSNLPPGPPGLPLLGNTLQIPREFLHVKCTEWAKTYGPVYSLNVMGKPWLVINSHKAAGDLLDRKSSASSARPGSIKASEFLSRGNVISLGNPGPLWRLFRKGAHESLNIRVCEAYYPMQEEEAAITVRGLIEHPELPTDIHAYRTSASVVWRVLYGGESLRLNEYHDARKIDETAEYLLKSTMPLRSIVDMFPFLRPVIARSKFLRRHADKFFFETTQIFNRFYEEACAKESSYKPVAKIFAELGDKQNLTHDQKSWSAGQLFAAGQDTTATAVQWFEAAMLLYPEVAKRAQDELDRVVGQRRPTFADRRDLPYVVACVKEVLRWRPPSPVGLPHSTSEDVEYNGYLIPKDTFIIDNIWAMTHDPELYPNPQAFDPTRFLDKDGQLRPAPPDTHDDVLVFGHGQRICPGRDLAYNSLFIVIATMLWAVDIKPPLDENGKEVLPDITKMLDLFSVVHPVPFKIRAVPRFPNALERLDVVPVV